ncbi:MAG: PA14 domain-containing protein [Acidobacteriota bacterium]|nr:PA14 domain-containing protein [Acidobacteriota bacterium]
MSPAHGQNIQFTQGEVGSGLDNAIQIPLRTYQGRAGADLPIKLYYSSRVWRVGHLETINNTEFIQYQSVAEAIYAEHSRAGWTTSLDPPKIEWPTTRDHYNSSGKEHCGVCGTGGGWRVARLYVHLPGGATHELRRGDSAYQGAQQFTGTFYAVDGSRLRYDSTGQTTGTLYLPDGSRYILNAGNAQRIDRNGNTLGYSATTRQWTDTLGRAVTVPLPAAPLAQDYTYTLPGVPGQYIFRWRTLSTSLTPGSPALRVAASRYLPFPNSLPTNQTGTNYPQPHGTGSYLFTSDYADEEATLETVMVARGQTQNQLFNPVVLKEVVLPDGTSYKFSYNIYGEIDKVVYPAGGYDQYTYAQVPGFGDVKPPYTQGSRGVTLRRQSVRGDGTDLAEWQFQGGGPGVTVTMPDKTRVTTLRHDFDPGTYYDAPNGTPLKYWPFGYEDARNGMVREVRTYKPNADGTQGPMMRRKLIQWEMSSRVIPQRLNFQGEIVVTAFRNARSNKDVNILLDTAGNALTSTATYQHDAAYQFDVGVEPTAASEYHFASTDQTTAQTGAITAMPLGTLARTTETSYMTGDAAYRGRNLLGLPAVEVIKDAAGNVMARKETEYDEAAYPLLSYASVTGWADPGTPARGNATTVRQFVDIAAGAYIETHKQYDQCGSVRNIWDSHEPSAPTHGHMSQVAYGDSFTDGVNRNTYAYPTLTVSPVPDPSGTRGSSAALQSATDYEFSTGLVTSSTDVNNQVTTYSYADDLGTADPMKRLRKVTRPAGGGWTKYNYGSSDNAGLTRQYVETITALDASRSTYAYQFYDGLGRPNRTFFYVGPNAYDTSDTQYDLMGRAFKVSQPYRTTGSAAPIPATAKWTTTTYDSLGRTRTVKTSDNAVVDISYSGSETTTTDQAGKKRRSQTDALGRLTQVTEDPLGLAYQTSYTYDVLGNLRKVVQGSQTRFYMYDAVSRLIRAKNPEQAAQASVTGTDPVTGNSQWSHSHTYDVYGNVQSRTDARGVVTTYTYDSMNRQLTVRYQSDPSATPGVDFYYDNQPNAKGALWKTATAADYTETLDRDATGRPRRNRQWFLAGGVWRYYDTTYAYNLAGGVTSQTYPSGRTVSYQYDAAGRLNDFRGTLGNGVSRVYSTGVVYDEAGRMRQEQFGTAAPVYNKRFYNERGQLSEIRVSTYSLAAPGQETNWNRGALINRYSTQSWSGSGTDNNGNLLLQMIYIPNDDQISGYQMNALSYAYDSLNRLDKVEELADGSAFRWRQDYDYDRYGNRTVNAANTTDGMPERQFTVNAANNRLGVPTGQAGTMAYDNAGNLTTDTYSGGGTRVYDAENRLTRETTAAGVVTGRYAYDGAGRRVRRTAGGQEFWHVYGLGGELVAEYGAGFTGTSVQQEYGYRAGELLVTASGYGEQGLQGDYFNSLDFTSPALTRTDPTVNFAWDLASPGTGVRTEEFTARWTGYVTPRYSQTYTFYTQSDDGVRLWVNDQLIIDKWIDQGTTEWSGQITLQAGKRYKIKMEFYERWHGAVAKLLWSSASQAKEVVPASQLTPPQGSVVKWLVKDQLGSPRMAIDQTGGLARVTRHDYLPFGEELAAGVGGRTYQQGYVADGTRQQFTGHERDGETGLDFMQARHYSSQQGRFTSVDSLSGNSTDPQSLNLYAYVLNNPLRYTDPTGHAPMDIGVFQTDDPVQARAAFAESFNAWVRILQAQRQKAEIQSGRLTTFNDFADFFGGAREESVVPQVPAGTEQGGAFDQHLATVFGEGPERTAAAGSGYEPKGLTGPYAVGSKDRSQPGGPLPNQWGHLYGYCAHFYGSQPGVTDTKIFVPPGFTKHLPPSGADAIAQFYYPELNGHRDVTLVVMHVHDWGIRHNEKNKAGSIRVGTSGLNNQLPTYRHTHIEAHRGWPAPMAKERFNHRNTTRIFFPNLFRMTK